MRLAARLTSMVLLVVITALVVDAYLSVQRETSLFRADMERDAQLLGRVLRDAVANVWISGGEQQALALIEQVNKAEETLWIRWLEIDELSDTTHVPRLTQKKLSLLRNSTTISIAARDSDNFESFYTYVLVPINNARLGVLELKESLDGLHSYTGQAVVRWFFLVGIVGSITGAIVVDVGVRVVGRPLNMLMDKARRVGEGDLTKPLMSRGRDELADLARSMNMMCERLDESQKMFCAEQEQRIATLEQLRHADRLKTVGRLAAGIAHEMGTPLNTISIRSGMIASGDVTGNEVLENARIIKEQAKRVTRIIQHFLEYARERKLEKRHVDLLDVANQTQKFLTPLCEKRGVTLQTTSTDKQSVTAYVDGGQIEHVLTNLVINAIHAMPSGGEVNLNIEHRIARPPVDAQCEESEYLSISVKDDGQGIPEENMKHIFEPFFTTKDVGDGCGLGLSIAYGIVHEHGGWIDVTSEPGKGTCFTIYLPTDQIRFAPIGS